MTTNTELPGWFLEVTAVLERKLEELEGSEGCVRALPTLTATNDKDGMSLPMTGKTAVKRRQEVAEAERQSVMRAQDAALVRALQWTGHWGG